ncbi:MAG: tetratricopeptide repeat protein [Deltaproteobacteria bacterium]
MSQVSRPSRGGRCRPRRRSTCLPCTPRSRLQEKEVAIDTLAARQQLGSVLYFAGRYDDAREATLAAVEGYRRAGLTDVEANADALSTLGMIETRLAHNEAAMARLTEARAIHERLGNPDTLEALRVLSRLAVVYTNMERYEEAEPMYLDLIERGKAALGEDPPEVALAVSNLAAQYDRTGRPKEAHALMKEALAIQSPSTPTTPSAASNVTLP